MSDLNYNINVDVEGGEKVETLKDNVVELNEAVDGIADTATLDLDSEGVTETAEGLDSISTTTADTKLADVGDAAGTATPKVGGLSSGISDMVSAIGLYTIASAGAEIVMNQIRERLDFIAQTKAWDVAQVDAYKAAVEEVGAGLEAIDTKLRDAGEFTNIETTGLFGLGGGSTTDAATALGFFGFTVDDVARVVRGGDEALAGFENRLVEAGLGGDLLDDVMGAVRDEADAYAEATNGAAERTAFFSETQASANDALQEMLDKQDPMRRFTDEWDLLTNGLRDGSIDTEAGADAINTLSQELGLTTEEVLALAQAQVDEGVAGAQAYNEALGSIDFRDADIQGATTAMSAFTTELFAAGNEAQARESAFDALAASAEGVALTFNMSTDAGRAQQDALEGVARVLDTDLAQAYDDANGNQDAFVASATKLGDETLARLQTELGLTDGQVETLRTTLGLTAQDYEARFALAGAEEARIQLGLLQGAIEGLPADVELQVTQQILAGDPVAALAIIQAYYSDPANFPVATVTTEADPTGANEGIAGVTDAEHPTTIVADADTITAAGELLTETTRIRIAKIVATADTATAAAELTRVTDAERTATIDAVLGSYPSASDIRARIGTVNVPVNVIVNTRIFGTRR